VGDVARRDDADIAVNDPGIVVGFAALMPRIADCAVARLASPRGHLVHLLKQSLQGFSDTPSPDLPHEQAALASAGLCGGGFAVVVAVWRDLVLEENLDDAG
jgi:hypothetical protein